MLHQTSHGLVSCPGAAAVARMAAASLLLVIVLPWVAQAQPTGIAVKKFPLPKDAKSVTYDQAEREIRFTTKLSIAAVGEFYQKEMKKLGWDEDFVSLASSFGTVDFEKDDKEIDIDLDQDFDETFTEVTVEGDGLFFSELEERAADPKNKLTFGGFDFPLLDAQSTSKDGSMEIIQFNSRKTVKENIDFHTKNLTSEGWKTKGATEKNGVSTLRFEKEGLYIRVALWPHSFSDNAGSYDGAAGAVEGTALIWGDAVPSGNVPQRMLREYQRSLGDLPPEKQKVFLDAVKEAREKIMTGRGDDR